MSQATFRPTCQTAGSLPLGASSARMPTADSEREKKTAHPNLSLSPIPSTYQQTNLQKVAIVEKLLFNTSHFSAMTSLKSLHSQQMTSVHKTHVLWPSSRKRHNWTKASPLPVPLQTGVRTSFLSGCICKPQTLRRKKKR